jgi:glycosyltransferase involved in cell wall biosynthesis
LLKVIPILRSLKVLQIVENLDNGAVETWLVRAFICSKKYDSAINWTFFCILPNKGINEDFVVENGGIVIHSNYPLARKLSFLLALRKTLKKGKYDVIHSHHDYISGFYFLSAFGLGIKRRIIHVHNLEKHLPVSNASLKKILLPLFYNIAYHFSDAIIGVSKDALNCFLGQGNKKKGLVLYCGIDFNLFINNSITPDSFRQNIGIDIDAKILLFVGRLDIDKNAIFIIDILNELLQLDPNNNYCAVFVGKGPLEERMNQKAHKLGISKNVYFAGFRDDLTPFYYNSDIFIFPRFEAKKEGLGLVLVEAQAASLPILTTKAIPEDAFFNKSLITISDTNLSSIEWAKQTIKILNGFQIEKSKQLQLAINSPFSLDFSTKKLLDIYKMQN